MTVDSTAPIARVRAMNRLSAVRISKVKVQGLYEDGGGLRLVVTDKGVKRWTLRLTIRGLRVERGLGVWPTVSLEDARLKADTFRRAARDGRDARREEKLARRRHTVTFKGAFDACFDVRRKQLSNGKHVQQWQNTMRDYVFPLIGELPVSDINAAEIFEVLEPIWFSKPETASRVLQRVKAVFDSAIVRGTREKANPCLGIARELGNTHRKVVHHRALAWQAVPAFVRGLCSRPMTLTRLLFEFLILTAVRSGEARGALWSEFDLDARTWTIPAFDPTTGRRTKAGQPHVVPLANRVLKILADAHRVRDGQLVFPGIKGQPLSDNTLSKIMRDGHAPGTPHGFRSAFKDWAAEGGVRDEVSEAALGHTDRDKVRAAYRRTRFLEERKMVMERWSEFVCGNMVA